MRRLLAVLVVLCIVAACSKNSNHYGDATRKAFLETCTINQDQPKQICECIYDKIAQQIPFDRYVELDKQMQADEKFVPDELVGIAADCASQLTTTTTESTTTTVPESTSSSSSSSNSPSSSSGPSSSSSSVGSISF
jgi:hypothetical protein